MVNCCIFIIKKGARVLAEIACKVEVRIGFRTLPGLHVKDRWSHSRKTTVSWNLFRFDNFHSKFLVFCCKKPLILESTFSVNGGEVSDSHDKVVNKLFRKWEKTSNGLSFPDLINNYIFFGTFNIICIVYNLGEVQFLYLDFRW